MFAGKRSDPRTCTVSGPDVLSFTVSECWDSREPWTLGKATDGPTPATHPISPGALGPPARHHGSSLDRAIPACALGLRAGDVEGCRLRCDADMSMSRGRPPQTSSSNPQPRPMTESEFHFHRRSRSLRGSFACACPPESVCPCPWAKPRGRNVCGDLDFRIVWYRFSLGPGPRGGKANAYYFNSRSRVRVRRRAGPSVRHVYVGR